MQHIKELKLITSDKKSRILIKEKTMDVKGKKYNRQNEL